MVGNYHCTRQDILPTFRRDGVLSFRCSHDHFVISNSPLRSFQVYLTQFLDRAQKWQHLSLLRSVNHAQVQNDGTEPLILCRSLPAVVSVANIDIAVSRSHLAHSECGFSTQPICAILL